MPQMGSISRRDLIRYLRALGFEGPYRGRKHQVMAKNDIVIRIPNPHKTEDISLELLARLLRQGKISKEDWERL